MSLFKTKAETLHWLSAQGFPVPEVMLFSVEEWEKEPVGIVRSAHEKFAPLGLAIRSSARSEDSLEASQAGAFKSVLHVPGQSIPELIHAIFDVKNSLPGRDDQIFIQPMVDNVIMSGVIMTRHLDDGSPYYVINYDDTSGRTDTITSGTGVSKTVFIYKGVRDEYFDSPRLRLIVDLAQKLERLYENEPLDIEFALDNELRIHLLQVRRICTSRLWNIGVEEHVNARIGYVESFVSSLMKPRYELFGKKTILGVMPDWNPAEMIGIAPRPLALSLYRELITRRTWSFAREEMGYRKMPPVELMLSVGGRPYIDVRASFNSFLPEGLPAETCELLVNAWLERLEQNPKFHDKVEFDIVHTIAEPDMDMSFAERYPGLLSDMQYKEYKEALLKLTNAAIAPEGTLDGALAKIEELKIHQEDRLRADRASLAEATAFDLVAQIGTAMEQCATLGTRPFSIIARHGFIAESLLRSAVRSRAISQERLAAFKRSIHTISGELTEDFQAVCSGALAKDVFLHKYGHLRPGTYDILSPSYAEREDLFCSNSASEGAVHAEFSPTTEEKKRLSAFFRGAGLTASVKEILAYAAKAIAGREYAKFIFTRHLSHILDLAAAWGTRFCLSREDVSMLSITEILDSVSSPLHTETARYYKGRARSAAREHAIMRTLKLSYIIRSPRDVYIVPQHRAAPNFITSGRVQAPVIHLRQHDTAPISLEGRIVCIESADPGYDWIFTRNIAGLVTRYGGTNSHMAIRCAEYGLPAAIGCGELLFERVAGAEKCLLDCAAKELSLLDVPLSREKAV